MMKNIIIIFTMLMTSFFNPALARVVNPNSAIKCVQIQLNSLGFNAGNEDGILQLETIEASKDYIKWAKNENINYSLPDLNINNAQIWCDIILKDIDK